MSAFEQTFRQKGISLTSSRLAIFEVLENASAHMTVTDIFNAARQKDPGLGMATVYRTLNMLCDLGLAEKHEFPNIDAVYEKTGAGNGHHHHISNRRCRRQKTNYIEFSGSVKNISRLTETMKSTADPGKFLRLPGLKNLLKACRPA